jgi:hypothetical protein
MRRTARLLPALVLVLLGISSTAWSAGPLDGHVRGVVVDTSGGTLAGVEVVATLAGLPIASATTDDQGAYEFVGLPASTIALTFHATGFSRQEIRVRVDDESWVAPGLTRSPVARSRRTKHVTTGLASASSQRPAPSADVTPAP